LFGIGGAALLLVATESGQAKPEELDGELLAACATFQREEAYQRQQYARVIAGEISERDADLLIEKRDEAYHAAADVICATPARTPEGLRAKAAAVVAFFSPDAPTISIMDDAMWSVLCQVAGKPEECA
jgi:hypothetical protein